MSFLSEEHSFFKSNTYFDILIPKPYYVQQSSGTLFWSTEWMDYPKTCWKPQETGHKYFWQVLATDISQAGFQIFWQIWLAIAIQYNQAKAADAHLLAIIFVWSKLITGCSITMVQGGNTLGEGMQPSACNFCLFSAGWQSRRLYRT